MTGKNQKNNKDGSGVGVGAGLVAVGTAIAAGYYFYVSDNAEKHRKVVADWATDLKDEVMDKADTLKENLNRETLLGLIDEVAETYYMAKSVSKEDVGAAVKELKDNWAKVVDELKSQKKALKSRAKGKKS